MVKKIVFTVCLFVSFVGLSQENNISITPPEMVSTSSIVISVVEKGNYILTIQNKKNKEQVFSKELYIKNKGVVKHNFSSYPKGEYYFIIKQGKKEIYKSLKTK